ncbi:MAG TPA: hypothetical protein VFF42_00505 [Candidatus Eremiobacteraceae bacterium]|nr:hypothetical protein [Candidatus Eremiobacteraceae bacterium]
MSELVRPNNANTAVARARTLFVGTLFVAILLVPRFLNLRRNEKTWTAFRIVMGMVGAALVILPLSLWNGLVMAVFGLALFIASILIPSSQPSTSRDDKARQLGALVVVNGGKYQPGNLPVAGADLFVGNENVWALDDHLQPLLVIPTAEISSARAENKNGRWILKIRWSDHAADFLYDGFFAEHLARVAESTINSTIPTTLPILPQRRAASA